MDYEPWVKARFSGVLCIDEVYDGPFCLILSTDPLHDVTVAYTLEKKAQEAQRPMMNQEGVDHHLKELKRIGLEPGVVMRVRQAVQSVRELGARTWTVYFAERSKSPI